MLSVLPERLATWNDRGTARSGAFVVLGALVRAAGAWVRRLICRLSGHEMTLHCEPGRLSLRCLECGAATEGWTIDVRPAFRRKAPASRRHA